MRNIAAKLPSRCCSVAFFEHFMGKTAQFICQGTLANEGVSNRSLPEQAQSSKSDDLIGLHCCSSENLACKATSLDGILGLIHTARLNLHEPSGIQVEGFVIRYALERFDLSAFEATGITLRPDILRSVPKRQAEFLFGRLAARQALLSLGCETIEVPSGAHRQPLWPFGMAGSITHSMGYAAAMVARLGPITAVGVDIEGIVKDAELHALLRTVINSEELRTLQSLMGGLALPTLVTLAFSAKEAFFKASFETVGRYFDFSAVRVSSINLASMTLELCVQEQLHTELSPGTTRQVMFGFLDACTLYTTCIW